MGAFGQETESSAKREIMNCVFCDIIAGKVVYGRVEATKSDVIEWRKEFERGGGFFSNE